MSICIALLLQEQGIRYEVLKGDSKFYYNIHSKEYHTGGPGDIILQDPVLGKQVTGLLSLGNVIAARSFLDLQNCKDLRSLGKLQYAYGFIDIRGTSITEISNPFRHAPAAALYGDGSDSIRRHQELVTLYKGKLKKLNPEDIPRELASAEYQWQRALCEDLLSKGEFYNDR